MPATLHIEHAITDLSTWLRAFAGFDEARSRACVVAHRVCQPVDDDRYIYVELDFEDTGKAESFRTFLETQVWTSLESSPALDGTPRARVLQPVAT